MNTRTLSILVLSLMFSTSTWSQVGMPGSTIYKSIYGSQDMRDASQITDRRVARLATGTCSLGTNETGSRCCSGFLVGEDLVMTNFHCMGCIHKKGKGMRRRCWSRSRNGFNLGAFWSGFFKTTLGIDIDPQDAPAMANSMFGPIGTASIVASANGGKTTPVKPPARGNKAPKPGMDDDDCPTNDLDVLNSLKEDFGRVNFNNVTGGEDEVYEIKKIEVASKEHDMVVFRIAKKMEDKHIFDLAVTEATVGLELLSISHPGSSPFEDGKRVYDMSESCVVSHAAAAEYGSRVDVFGHQCDTNPGSSGSPIIDRATGTVVGLHWGGGARRFDQWGFSQEPIDLDDVNSYNKAVELRSITNYLRDNAPGLLELDEAPMPVEPRFQDQSQQGESPRVDPSRSSGTWL